METTYVSEYSRGRAEVVKKLSPPCVFIHYSITQWAEGCSVLKTFKNSQIWAINPCQDSNLQFLPQVIRHIISTTPQYLFALNRRTCTVAYKSILENHNSSPVKFTLGIVHKERHSFFCWNFYPLSPHVTKDQCKNKFLVWIVIICQSPLPLKVWRPLWTIPHIHFVIYIT